MSNTQTFILKINPKNSTFVMPKKVRQLICSDKLLLSIKNEEIKLTIAKCPTVEVLTTPPTKRKSFKMTTKEEIKVIAQGIAVKRYLKSK